MTTVFFQNSLPDSPSKPLPIGLTGKLLESDELKHRIDTKLAELLHDINANALSNRKDASVYTGLTGIALLHYKIGRLTGQSNHFETAQKLLQICPTGGTHGPTFLCGSSGPLAVGAVVAYKLGDKTGALKRVQQVLDLSNELNNPETPDELLYGRAGYLYALLFLRHELLDLVCSQLDGTMEEIASQIIRNGIAFASSLTGNPPMMWQWHDSLYLGAAHGVAGILHTLLLAMDYAPVVRSHLESHIRPTLDWLLGQRYPSGNFFSSVGSSSDRLVHWCHGAPAMTHLLVRAAQLWPGSGSSNVYLDTALLTEQVTWQRGLLFKGYGICHGVAGNAYVFLALYAATKDPVHLHRAMQFAEWCLTSSQRKTRTPDRPFSLFEGSAGTAWFLADLSFGDLSAADFPAYQLPCRQIKQE